MRALALVYLEDCPRATERLAHPVKPCGLLEYAENSFSMGVPPVVICDPLASRGCSVERAAAHLGESAWAMANLGGLFVLLF
jgi:hypothetical protein